MRDCAEGAMVVTSFQWLTMQRLSVAEGVGTRDLDHGRSLGFVDTGLERLWGHVGADLLRVSIERLVLAGWNNLLEWLNRRWWWRRRHTEV